MECVYYYCIYLLTLQYYREAVGALVVFDVSRNDTFPPVAEWKADLDAKVMLLDQQPVPAILIANKARFLYVQYTSCNVKHM